MSMHATVYGRAGRDARQHQTKAGKDMTTCRVAVDVTGKDDEQQTLWVDVLAFGRVAEDLARIEKGSMVSAMGRITRGTYQAKDGTERESWTMLADGGLDSARRPPTEGRASRSRRRSSSGRPLTSMTRCRFDVAARRKLLIGGELLLRAGPLGARNHRARMRLGFLSFFCTPKATPTANHS